MKELFEEVIKETETASAQEVLDILVGAGYSKEDGCDLINTAQDQGIIKIIFAASALTSEDPDGVDMIVTMA